MAEQRMVLTPIPSGRVGSDLSLWVHVSPRLSGGTALADFPDWVAWPATLAAARISVEIEGTRHALSPQVEPSAVALWTQLFPPTLRVDPAPLPDFDRRFVHSYPVVRVASAIQRLYQGIGADHPDAAPTAAKLAKDAWLLVPPAVGSSPNAFAVLPSDPSRALEQVKRHARDGRTVPETVPGMTPTQRTQFDLYRARVFHQAHPAVIVPDAETRQPVAQLAPLDEGAIANAMDFHKLVAALGDHPLLMRRLGLAFELRLPASVSVPPRSEVRITWSDPPLTTPATLLGATTVVKGPTFAPYSPAGSEVVDGFLNLGDVRYELVSLDVDGAALKLAQLSEGLGVGERARSRGGSPQEHAALAALRSDGIALVRSERATQLVSGLDRARAMERDAAGGTPPALTAVDLVRGYRIDVRSVSADGTSSSPWRSLCRRASAYLVADGSVVRGDDEGWVSLSVSEKPGGPDLYLHEALTRWRGWSLCVERPGTPLPDRASDGGAPFGFRASFAPVRDSLPALRFGRTYQFRARAANLVGHGVALTSDENQRSTRPHYYGRFEPVAVPFVVLRTPVAAGETTDALVLRSFNDAPSKDRIVNDAASERHVAPPRVSAELAEQAGALDDSAGKPRADLYEMLAARHAHAADLADRPGQVVAEADWSLPYLPDPMAVGVTVFGLPGPAPGARDRVALRFADGAAWPSPRPLRFLLREGARGYSFNAAARVLEIRLPKGEKINIAIASMLDEAGLDKLVVWRWLRGSLGGAALAALTASALRSELWMLTPRRELQVVHAVQQPLRAPAVRAIRALRDTASGQALARIEAEIDIHGKSTGIIAVVAAWQERRDEPSDPSNDPEHDRSQRSTPAFKLDLSFDQDEVPELRDTPLRDGEGRSTALYLPGPDRLMFPAASHGVLPENAPKMAFDDARHRRVSLTLTAGTRFASYLVALGAQEAHSVTRSSAPVLLDIPSGVRPAAPVVHRVVPTFGWRRDAGQRVREGRGLRVYLERPWFSSGDGELLAVVLRDPASSLHADELTTLMGRDPAWPSAIPVGLPRPTDFTSAIDFGAQPDESGPGLISPRRFATSELSTEENANVRVRVACHPVLYDAVQGLWYADIVIATSAYHPFVRLALARYQPRAQAGVELSRIVPCDIHPLLADRALSIVSGRGQVSLTLTGPAPMRGTLSGAVGAPGTVLNRVEVHLEDHPGGGVDLDWRSVSGPHVLAAEGVLGGPARWSGSVELPAAPVGRRRRLVVREYEVLPPAEPGAPQHRLVYLDLVGL